MVSYWTFVYVPNEDVNLCVKSNKQVTKNVYFSISHVVELYKPTTQLINDHPITYSRIAHLKDWYTLIEQLATLIEQSQ